MATKKDLVEAYSFSRRRLVTAFVSGAPGGREVEPARPGRTVVGGLALAVLLAAGAAIAGVFSPRTPDDWNQAGLLISKETGAAYVIIEESEDPELRPVINSTSAKLILGSNSEPTLISQDTIDDQRIGEDIGILGAPASLPTSSLLIDTGWTACTASGQGVRATVSDQPDFVPAPGRAVTVVSGGDYYVIAQSARVGDVEPGAYAYAVPPQEAGGGRDQTDSLLTEVGAQDTRGAVEVPRQWLTLFPPGRALDWSSFQLDRLGEKPDADMPPGRAANARIGNLLEVEGGVSFLVTDSGPVPLSEFATSVYRNLILPGGDTVKRIPISTVPGVDYGREILKDASWPADVAEPIPGDPCAQLTAEHGEMPVVQLVSPGEATGAGDVELDEKDPVVAPGRGAYVLSGGWADSDHGLPFVIDSKGRAYPLVGQGTADLLGYGEHPVVVVPDSWVELFDCGVNLSQDSAMLPPTQESGPTCE